MDDIQKIEIAANKTRFKLLTLLLKEGESYVTKLGEDLKTERKTTAFHLQQLEKAGLVESKYAIKDNKPVAIRNYKITSSGRRIYDHIVSLK